MEYHQSNTSKRRLSQAIGVLKYILLRIIYSKNFTARGISLIYRGSKFDIQSQGKIILHGKISISPESRISARGTLEIGKNFSLNQYSRVIAFEKIVIGDNVTIAQFVSILDHDHRSYIRCSGEEKELIFEGYNCEPISIGSNVWIADKVTILKGVKIGSNVIIGANSVVKSDIPDFSIAVGAPAKVVKRLDASKNSGL